MKLYQVFDMNFKPWFITNEAVDLGTDTPVPPNYKTFDYNDKVGCLFDIPSEIGLSGNKQCFTGMLTLKTDDHYLVTLPDKTKFPSWWFKFGHANVGHGE